MGFHAEYRHLVDPLASSADGTAKRLAPTFNPAHHDEPGSFRRRIIVTREAIRFWRHGQPFEI